MIPRDYITEWRKHAPWVEDFQVEQDLAISRALVAIFDHPVLRESLAFRGGTALSKLRFRPPARYSEDIDLVQIRAEPAGPMMDSLREVLDPWLGEPRRNQSEARVTLSYRFRSEDLPSKRLRLKVEINSENISQSADSSDSRSRSPPGGSMAVRRSHRSCSTSCSPRSCAPSISAERGVTCSIFREHLIRRRSTRTGGSGVFPLHGARR